MFKNSIIKLIIFIFYLIFVTNISAEDRVFYRQFFQIEVLEKLDDIAVSLSIEARNNEDDDYERMAPAYCKDKNLLDFYNKLNRIVINKKIVKYMKANKIKSFYSEGIVKGLGYPHLIFNVYLTKKKEGWCVDKIEALLLQNVLLIKAKEESRTPIEIITWQESFDIKKDLLLINSDFTLKQTEKICLNLTDRLIKLLVQIRIHIKKNGILNINEFDIDEVKKYF